MLVNDPRRSEIGDQQSGLFGKSPQPELSISRQLGRGYPRQLLFSQLLTWPADQPRHATYLSTARSNPIRPRQKNGGWEFFPSLCTSAISTENWSPLPLGTGYRISDSSHHFYSIASGGRIEGASPPTDRGVGSSPDVAIHGPARRQMSTPGLLRGGTEGYPTSSVCRRGSASGERLTRELWCTQKTSFRLPVYRDPRQPTCTVHAGGFLAGVGLQEETNLPSVQDPLFCSATRQLASCLTAQSAGPWGGNNEAITSHIRAPLA